MGLKETKQSPTIQRVQECKSTGVASVLNIESGTEVLSAHLVEPGQVGRGRRQRSGPH